MSEPLLSLPQLNIWADIVTVLIALFLLSQLAAQFVGSVITGRIRSNFKEGKWHAFSYMAHSPHSLKEEFPLPVRVWHWIHWPSFFTLLVTGIYIRYPFFSGGRETMRMIHYFFMYLITADTLFRIVYTFIINPIDRAHFSVKLSDLKWAHLPFMYYAFVKKSYPHTVKFHPIQRIGYASVLLILLPVQAISGFSLVWPQTFLGPIAGITGGIANTAAWMRFVHSVNMRFIFLFLFFHIYFAVVEDWPRLKLVWFFKEPPPELLEHHEEHGEHDGHDEGGHHDEHAPVPHTATHPETPTKGKKGKDAEPHHAKGNGNGGNGHSSRTRKRPTWRKQGPEPVHIEPAVAGGPAFYAPAIEPTVQQTNKQPSQPTTQPTSYPAAGSASAPSQPTNQPAKSTIDPLEGWAATKRAEIEAKGEQVPWYLQPSVDSIRKQSEVRKTVEDSGGPPAPGQHMDSSEAGQARADSRQQPDAPSEDDPKRSMRSQNLRSKRKPLWGKS